MSAPRPFIFEWHAAILESELPTTTRLLLFVIGTYMRADGSGAWPSQATIRRGMGSGSPATVAKHVRIAVEAGFLSVDKTSRGGQGWSLSSYTARIPAPKALHEVKCLSPQDDANALRTHCERIATEGTSPDDEGTSSGGEGTSPRGGKALHEVNTIIQASIQGNSQGNIHRSVSGFLHRREQHTHSVCDVDPDEWRRTTTEMLVVVGRRQRPELAVEDIARSAARFVEATGIDRVPYQELSTRWKSWLQLERQTSSAS